MNFNNLYVRQNPSDQVPLLFTLLVQLSLLDTKCWGECSSCIVFVNGMLELELWTSTIPSPCRRGLIVAIIGVFIPEPSAPRPDPGDQPMFCNILLPILVSAMGSAKLPITGKPVRE